MGFSTNKFVRGSVWWCNFDDKNTNDTFVLIGKHPCVIISCDNRNVKRGTVIVAPLTSNGSEYNKSNNVIIASIDGKKDNSIILVNQITTVDCRDLYSYEGILQKSVMDEVGKSILWHLGLDIYEKETICEIVNEEKPENDVKIDKIEKILWTDELKQAFLKDYDTLGSVESAKKYNITNAHAAHCRAYEYRKQFGLISGKGKKKKCKIQ